MEFVAAVAMVVADWGLAVVGVACLRILSLSEGRVLAPGPSSWACPVVVAVVGVAGVVGVVEWQVVGNPGHTECMCLSAV